MYGDLLWANKLLEHA